MDEKVSLIGMYCEEGDILAWLSRQKYENIDIAWMRENHTFSDLVAYIMQTDSSYLCFVEPEHVHFEGWLKGMISLIKDDEVDMAIADRYFIEKVEDKEYHVLGHGDPAFLVRFQNEKVGGSRLLEECFRNDRNVYGDLSCLLVKTAFAKRALDGFLIGELPLRFQRFAFLFQLIDNAVVRMNVLNAVGKYVPLFREDDAERKDFCDFLEFLDIDGKTVRDIYCSGIDQTEPGEKRKKEITFFYTDKGEYYNLQPVAQEAEKRDYKVRFTKDIHEKAEIGVYCQHYCEPENSEFSVIMLHDLWQGDDRWPYFWQREPWDKFDLGILPGAVWKQLYARNKFLPNANPRHGVYVLGYPKSDYADSSSISERARLLLDQLNMPHEFTVLYAPSWENDGKEEDAVRAVEGLPVNLLIKQADWMPIYADIINNIKDMRNLHEGKYPNVFYLEPEESIMVALAMADMVLSDESSVMTEALMFSKPSLAVEDWLIPDVTPPRPAYVPYAHLRKCERAGIRNAILQMKEESDRQISMDKERDGIFDNIGHVSTDIMDAIDYFTGNGKREDFKEKRVESYFAFQSLWN